MQIFSQFKRIIAVRNTMQPISSVVKKFNHIERMSSLVCFQDMKMWTKEVRTIIIIIKKVLHITKLKILQMFFVGELSALNIHK